MNRREMLLNVGLATGLTLLGPGARGVAHASTASTRALWPVQGEGDQRFGYEPGKRMAEPRLEQVLLLGLGNAWQAEVDVDEYLDTARRVDPEDESSWAREWIRTAERVREAAQQAEAKGRVISAGEAWLRASTYYRAALHRHPEPHDPDGVRLARHVLVGFTRSLRLLGVPAQPVLIPYEGTTLPGYFFRSPGARSQAPVLIVHPGSDAWAEDFRFLAEAAIKRGYHCLLFDAPGRGKALRLQGLPFRPDWEKVVTPVVDWVLEQRGVAPDRIALLGPGMGGSLAPRAAAFEKRLKLSLASPGLHSWVETVYEFIFGQRRGFQEGVAEAGAAKAPWLAGAQTVGGPRMFDWLDEHL